MTTPMIDPMPLSTGNPYAPLPPSAPEPKRRRGRGAALIAGAGVTALLGGAVGGAVGYTAASRQDVASTTGTATVAAPAAAASGSIAEIAAAVQPAVVQLDVKGAQEAGTGSGFIISSDGYIITNNHVAGVAGNDGVITVNFNDGKTATGKLVGASADYDLAVVKVDRTGLPAVQLGESKNLRVGDMVVALGSPLGLQGTVTSGIVSALDRPVTAGGEANGNVSYIDAIQTDAAINPGNSGGPLVDGNGAVIGVNSAIASMTQGSGQAGSIGLGFSIPIDTAKRISNEIIKTGSAKTPMLGIKLDMQFEGPGAKVVDVSAGGAAEAAGLRVDDVIRRVDDKRVADPTDLIVTVRSYAPGDTITLTVDRDGEKVQLPLTLKGQAAQ